MRFSLFLHGTNSSVFTFLPKTALQLSSPLEMLQTHQLAPMTGELILGGYKTIGYHPAHEDIKGKTSFIRISRQYQYEDSYSLDAVISKYSHSPVVTKEKSQADFQHALASGFQCAFSNLNLLLIYLTRARQTHSSLNQIIFNSQIDRLLSELNATKQFYFFFRLLGTHIHPNFKRIDRYERFDNLNAIGTLTFETIANRIMQDNIDMQFIFNNPTKENLQKALSVLVLPNNCKIKNLETGAIQTITLYETQFFCLDADYQKGITLSDPTEIMFDEMTLNSESRGHPFNEILKLIASKAIPQEQLQQMGKCAANLLTALEDRIGILHKILAAPQQHFEMSPMQRYFLQNPFPVIFISENDSQFIKVSLEYRSLTPLTLGVDITKIATETDWQRLQVLKFLEQHGIHTVQVILFEDLEACKKTFKQPESPYQDVNGKPTSNWLLALKKPTQQMFFKQTKSNATTEDSAHMTPGELLLDSAKKYHEIDLGSKEAHLSTATSEHSIEAAAQAFARMRF